MFRRLFLTLPFCLGAVLAAACGSSSTTSTNITSPSNTRCQPTVSATTTQFNASGGTGNATVSVARECSWSAASDASWLVITSGREGQGDGTIAYRIETNGDPVTRRGSLSVGEARVAVAQEAAPCRFAVAADSAALPAEGGQFPVDVRTHALCSWTASATAGWAAPSPASGSGDALVRILVAANDSSADRTTDVVVAGERISVRQSARAAPPPPAPAPPPPAPAPPPPAPAPPAPAPPPEPPGDVIDLDGRIGLVLGRCPTVAFSLEGRTVYTTADTEYRKGSCEDLRLGTKVRVRGREMSNGTVRAERIELDR